MPPFEEPSHTPGSAPRGPIFVDASGRRLRRIRILGLAALALVAGYVVLLMVALAGGPNVGAPYLPRPAGAAAFNAPATPPKSKPSPRASAVEAALPGRSGGIPPAAPEPGTAEAPPSSAPVPPPSAPAAAETTASLPRAGAAAQGTVPDDPGMSGAAPGQASKPTPPAHP